MTKVRLTDPRSEFLRAGGGRRGRLASRRSSPGGVSCVVAWWRRWRVHNDWCDCDWLNGVFGLPPLLQRPTRRQRLIESSGGSRTEHTHVCNVYRASIRDCAPQDPSGIPAGLYRIVDEQGDPISEQDVPRSRNVLCGHCGCGSSHEHRHQYGHPLEVLHKSSSLWLLVRHRTCAKPQTDPPNRIVRSSVAVAGGTVIGGERRGGGRRAGGDLLGIRLHRPFLQHGSCHCSRGKWSATQCRASTRLPCF